MKSTLRYAALMFAIGLFSASISFAQWASGPGSVTGLTTHCGPGGCGPAAGTMYGNYPSTGYDATFGGPSRGNGVGGNYGGYAASAQPYAISPSDSQPYAAQSVPGYPAASYPTTNYPPPGYAAARPAVSGYAASGYAPARPGTGTSGYAGMPQATYGQVGQRQLAAYDPQSAGGGAAGTPPPAPYGSGNVTAPYGTIGSPMPGGPLPGGAMNGGAMNGAVMNGPGMAGGTWPYGYDAGEAGCVNGPLMDSSWGDCPVVATGAPRCGPTWFGGIYGLIMNRDNANGQFYLVDPTVVDCGCLNSRDADMEYAGGYEVRIGRTFCQGAWGIEYIYWQLYPNAQVASVSGAGLTGTIPYTDVWLTQSGGDDTAANLFTDGNITGTCLHRDWEFQNIEINLLSRPLYAGCGLFGGGGCGAGGGCGVGCGAGYGPACGAGPCCGPCAPPRLRIGWLFGVRYFRFDESWRLAYDNVDNIFDGADPDSEFNHYIGIDNDLVGAQLGLNLDYYLTRSLQLEVGSKFGLFGNRMTQHQQVYNGYGYGYVIPGSPEELNIRSDKTDVAFLGELRAGLGYKVGYNWRITGGYRALALSGVALATNQIPFGRSFTNLAGISGIDRNGELILHGAYAGIEFAW